MIGTDAEIAFPDWVPLRVQQAASQIVAARVAERPIVERLATDERMRTVWRELNKRERDDQYRTTHEPMYPSTLPSEAESWTALGTALQTHAVKERTFGNDDRARELEKMARVAPLFDNFAPKFDPLPAMKHDMALAALFVEAVARRVDGKETLTHRELQARVTAEREGGRAAVADALSRLPDDPFAARFIVVRRRTDARVEAYVEAMAHVCRSTFGNDLPGIVATLTNVAFDRNDMTRDRVRAILKAPAPAKSA